MNSFKSVQIFSLGVAALFLTAASASANITPVFTSVGLFSAAEDTTIYGGTLSADVGVDFLWTYSFQVDATQQIQAGQAALCLDELQGLVVGSGATTGTNWSASTGASGGCQSASPAIGSVGGSAAENSGAWLEVAYNSPGALTSGQLGLGNIYFLSSDGTANSQDTAFGAHAQSNTTTNPTFNQGEVNGPLQTTPEPATLALVGFGLLGLGLIRGRAARNK